MSNDDGIRRPPPRITQEELRVALQAEDTLSAQREQIRRKLFAGASCEPGEYSPNRRTILEPLPSVVQCATPRSLPMAVLTFRDLRILCDFRNGGQFYPREIREMLDRFAVAGSNLFAAHRDRARLFGCWNMSKHLTSRVEFGYHIRRARILVQLHEWGIFDATGCIIGEIQAINRRYFLDPGQDAGTFA